MSDTNDKSNMFDPLGMMKSMRDANMESWAKAMRELVESDTYTAAQAEMLNAWLSNTSALRKALDESVTLALRSLHLATSDDYERLSERLTNIEMRLDDMDAKLDQMSAKSNAS